MDDLQSLYQQVILDHSRHPRHFGVVDGEDVLSFECFNRLCGDQISVRVKVIEGKVAEIGFTGKGCAICVASASLMCEHMQNRLVDEVGMVFAWFLDLVKTGEITPLDGDYDFRKLEVFKGVGAFPMRVKCATCAWHGLLGALGIHEHDES